MSSAQDHIHGAEALTGVYDRDADTLQGWHLETLYPEYAQTLRVDEVLYEDKSGDQSVRLIRNERFGRVLFLDGILQTTEADEFIYHEMLAHTPILAHGDAKRVLIIGGGDGGMLREVVRHQSVEHVTMVEIDQRVIDFSKLHLPTLSDGAFDDPRVNLLITDGVRYMAEATETFDVIIVDRSDPIGPARGLYTDSFYQNCKARLTEGGVLVTQNGVPFMQPDELSDTAKSMNKIFRDFTAYLATVPTYVGGPMAFGWASDNPSLRQLDQKTIEQRFAAARLATKYYSPAVHGAAFALPPFIDNLVKA